MILTRKYELAMKTRLAIACRHVQETAEKYKG